MAHLEYHNNFVDLYNIWHKSHTDIIRNVCLELDSLDRVSEFEEKYLNKFKLKAKKDPNKPKRAKTSYMYFCEEMRKELKGELVKLNIPQQSKKFSKIWSSLDDECKQKYRDLSNDDKNRYEEQISKYIY